MNKRLHEMPTLGSDAYAPTMPVVLTNLLRLVSILFAAALVWLGMRDWTTLPVWVLILICLLAPVFFFSAFNSRGWALYAKTPFFLADHLGMYFKHRDAMTKHLGKDAEIKNLQRKTWLFVPWENISNIRVAKVVSYDGTSEGAAMDVKATAEEVTDFFIDDLEDRQPINSDRVAVAFYTNMPPRPRKIVSILQEMMARYKKSALSAKYERAR